MTAEEASADDSALDVAALFCSCGAIVPCPWDSLAPGTVRFCEPRLCAWVAEPSNAWSSAAYVIVGLWLVRSHAARARDPRLWAVAIAEILIGLGSFAFHATGSFAGELLDQVGMFMLSCLILAFVWGKAKGFTPARTAQLYVGLTAASSLFLLVVRPAGIPLFAVQLAAGLGWEVARWRRAPDRGPYRYLFAGIAVFLGAFVVWTLDITGVACSPTNHLVTGHAVWHLMNAVSIERLYRFYAASRSPQAAMLSVAPAMAADWRR